MAMPGLVRPYTGAAAMPEWIATRMDTIQCVWAAPAHRQAPVWPRGYTEVALESCLALRLEIGR